MECIRKITQVDQTSALGLYILMRLADGGIGDQPYYTLALQHR